MNNTERATYRKPTLILLILSFSVVWAGAQKAAVYYLNGMTDREILIPDFKAVNSSVEFDLTPQNSAAGVGVLLRYADKNNWIYVGCDKATDHLGFAYWSVETPTGKIEIARDIAKLYAHHLRRIKVNCTGETITIYVDGEQIAHQYIPGLPQQAGQIGFRVRDKGNVQISGVVCKLVQAFAPVVAKKKKGYTLSSPAMDVVLNKDFPSVQSYTWKKNRARMSGQQQDMASVTINGDRYRPKVSSRMEANRVSYTLKVKEIGVTLEVCCEVTGPVLQLRITRIEEGGGVKVKTVAFADHSLVSVSHTASGACLSVANGVHSDSIFPLKEKGTDPASRYGTILLLNTDRLVATLESNSIYSTRQFLYQTTQLSGTPVTGIWGNEWIYRGHDGAVIDMPYIKVILSDDCNQDGKVDWQDGAMALQKEYPEPFGADQIRNAYATITMNFASCAQYPFLRQLDNIKKFYLATDGFGQLVELKGYQAEGHDSAHPDYSGNYNQRAGGVKELVFLVDKAKKYNAGIGLHINHSESYPEARAFNDRIVTDMPSWSWLDQSYFINKEADLLAGDFEKRLNQLKADVPDLSFIYIDTYREYRWLAHRTARLFHQNNWAVWTEDADVFDQDAVWIHYQPESKSLIHRFVHHRFRDGYAEHPALLGGYSRSSGIGFMGWQKGRDFHGVIRNFFTKQLPYRYLMHFPVRQLDTVSVVLSDGLVAYQDKEAGTVIQKGDCKLMAGGCVFIPWNPVTEEKIYHYNAAGGKTSWQLPASWGDRSQVNLYSLGSQGRTFVRTLPVSGNQIVIEALPETGYVIYKDNAATPADMEWGAGSPVKDMGFDSESFDHWHIRGEEQVVSMEKTTYGQSYVLIKGTTTAGVEQEIGHLIPDREYIASVWANVGGKKKAVLAVQTGENRSQQCSISESNVFNYTDNTDRFKTTWQRLKVPFRVPAGRSSVTLCLTGIAADDTSSVAFDDVRIVEGALSQKEGYDYFEDFEQVDEGWGPFIASQPSAFTTHLSQKHDEYTENTINGEVSLVTWRERSGEVYRTSPAQIRFTPGQPYTIDFDYRVDNSGVYKVVGISKELGRSFFSYDLNRAGKCRVDFVVPECTDFYIAVLKQGDGQLVIDNFGIKGKLEKE